MKKTFHLRAELSLSTITYSKGNAFPWAFSSDRTALHRTACSNSNSCKCSAFTPSTPAPQLWQLPNEKDRAPPAPLTQGFTACVAGALAAVAVQRGELLIRLAQFADAAARREARRLPPIGVAST